MGCRGPIRKKLKSPQTFSLYALDGPAGQVVLTRNANHECYDGWTGSLPSGRMDGIAIQSPSWNVMPRLPKPLDRKDPAYVRIVSEILQGAGIAKPEVSITQAYDVDLDGDGNQEVVIVANRYAQALGESSGIPTQTSPGDYTLVIVRKTVGQNAQNIFVVKAVWLKANEGALPRVNHLSAIADLNGDGIMELVLSSVYYEGSDSDVVQIKGSKPAGVLACACEH